MLAGELLSALETNEFDQERQPLHVAPELFDEVRRRAGGAARRKEIVDDEYALPFGNRIVVHLERIGPVLERVAGLHRFRRQLARLADGRKTRVDAIRDRGAENEAAAFDADDDVDALIDVGQREAVDRGAEADLVLQQRRDVVKQDAGLRKVRYVADFALQLIHMRLSNPKPGCPYRQLVGDVDVLDVRVRRSVA